MPLDGPRRRLQLLIMTEPNTGVQGDAVLHDKKNFCDALNESRGKRLGNICQFNEPCNHDFALGDVFLARDAEMAA